MCAAGEPLCLSEYQPAVAEVITASGEGAARTPFLDAGPSLAERAATGFWRPVPSEWRYRGPPGGRSPLSITGGLGRHSRPLWVRSSRAGPPTAALLA